MGLKTELANAFDKLQGMEIRATKANLDALELALMALKKAYDVIPEETEKDGVSNGTD